MVCEDETGSSRIEMTEAGSISGMGCVENNTDDDLASQWAAVERMHTFERVGSSLVDENDGRKDDLQRKQVVDITKLGDIERQCFIDKLIKHIEHDNLCLLQKVRERIDKTGVRLPTVEVRYNNLRVEAECEVVHGKPLPTLWNTLKNIFSDFTNLPGLQSQKAKITLIDDVCGIIKPGCMTLLLGPPGCGKTTLLKALSGNVNSSLKVSGEVSYNGYKLEDFIPQKTSAYISQNDVHVPEMTVRETLDFSARCQGVGSRAELMAEVIKSEKQAGIFPDPDIDTYMKAISIEGRRTTLQTDYIMKILGIDICADTLYGDAMRRGISGGQKKRLTTGEMIVGPKNALFMDEISNGLDSSTAYKIVTCLQQLVHITDATALVALLQPSPETFQLFDDIILMGEGKILYHGPRSNVLEFFDDCGFRCPSRKGIADFLQEVISRKDQARYWHRSLQSYSYVSVDMFSKKFKESLIGKNQNKELKNPFVKSEIHKKAISFNFYSLPKWTMLRACMSREILLMRRNSSLYICRSVQLFVIACITTTVFLRTRMDVDAIHANDYMGALFYGLTKFFFDGFMELSGTVRRLEVFYKQRELYFYPAWAYAIPASILKFPILLVQALIWTSVTYYGIGYSPEAARFFRQVFVFFAVNVAATSMFRFLASVFRTMVTSTIASSVVTLLLLLCSGFILPEPSMPVWLKWLYWISPVSYGEIGLALNEFLAPRWQKPVAVNTTVGKETLKSRGLDFNADFYWLSLGALFGLAIVFNIGFILALTYLNPPVSRAMISKDRLSQIHGTEDLLDDPLSSPDTNNKIRRGKVVLPFQPLTLVFQDVQYYIETPLGMRERGFAQKKLQLLCDVSGVFMPGVLTALMGVSGAGKTTLLDVLSGRKTSGTIEGNIRIGGYPKVQETFVRISGYCEQTDIHSPQITVEESVIYSAWLRLLPEIDSKTKFEFVKEVLEIIELDEIKDCLVGMAGVSGLSTEQRKRLTIAVELVANPSIIFMDEPTTGLDARAAAIAMRAVKNVADTGRTIVCTIHQPSIDIFEAFDELILLKDGGHVIYSGPLGQHSSSVIDYFQAISGVPKIQDNYNPGTWMLEVTSPSAEAKLGIDFAQVYQSSSLYQDNKVIAHRLSIPPPGSRELYFGSRYSQKGWGQFKSCLWKQNLSYWRSPSYNLMRTLFMLVISLFFGILLWDQGKDINKQQHLFNVIGATFVAVLFIAINNSSSAIPYIFTERTIFYRERFAGMYGPWAYAFSQVIIEVPYLLAQAVIFVAITYPMIGYHWSAFKFFWYFHTILCTMVYFTYLGMLVVSIAPSFAVAMILQAAMFTVLNLFSGFLIPQPEIPKWWQWMYYLTPTSWTLKAIITSQYGDRDSEIVAFGETKTLSAFLNDYFGYHRDQLPVAGVVLFLFPVVFASLFAFFIGKLNFQRR